LISQFKGAAVDRDVELYGHAGLDPSLVFDVEITVIQTEIPGIEFCTPTYTR